MRYKAVMFDVIGTTVVEKDPTVIARSFEKAFRDHGIQVDEARLRANRGRDKKEIIDVMLKERGAGNDMAPAVYDSFVRNVEANLHAFEPRDGAMELFDFLQQCGMKVALGTGLSRDLFARIMKQIDWPLLRFDYVGIPEHGIRPRPHADMLQDMMAKLRLTPMDVLKVGDTVADIQEGKNAGVATVAILAGTQSREMLEQAQPTFVIETLNELRQIVS